MEDVFGNKLNVGDTVATTIWGQSSKTKADLGIAVVIGFSNKKVRIQYTDGGYVTTKYPSQLAKKFEENPFADSIRYMQNLGISENEILEIAEHIYIDTVSKMDY